MRAAVLDGSSPGRKRLAGGFAGRLALGSLCCAAVAARAQAQSLTPELGDAPPRAASGPSSTGPRASDAGGTGLPALASPAGVSVLPLTGVGTRVGDLRNYLLDSFGQPLAPAATTRSWEVIPEISLFETLTDNATGTQSGHGDIITNINPSLTIRGDTPRVQVNLNYSPNIELYAFTAHQNQVAQNFSGSALAAIVPNEVFLSVQGASSLQSRYGTTPQTSNIPLSQQDMLQTNSYAITPYFSHSFGANGTLQGGYSQIYSSSSEPAGINNPNLSNGPILPGNFGNGSVSTSREFLNYITGENLGRFQDSFQVDASQYSGTGVLQSAHRTLVLNTLAYAVIRSVDVIGALGYEDLRYSGLPPTRISDAAWEFGARLRPDPNSTATIAYRHLDGISALYVDAAYQVTARLRVYGTYSEGLSTAQQDLQSDLLLSRIDQTGNPLNSVTGAPLLSSDGGFGFENDLYRVKRLSATAALVQDREIYVASVQHETRSLAATTNFATANQSDDGTFATLSWSHALEETLNSTVALTYGSRTLTAGPLEVNAQSGSENLYGVSATLLKRFTPTLFGSAQYSFTHRTSAFENRPLNENVLIVGLTKRF